MHDLGSAFTLFYTQIFFSDKCC